MKKKGIRAVSIFRNYGGPTAQDERTMVLQTGQVQVLQKGLQAEPWRFGDVTEWERMKVAERFGDRFRGVAYGENPLDRLSTFDSLWAQEVNGWSDEEREIVEQRVVHGPGNDVDYIIVDQPSVPAPWPSYDALRVQGKRTVELVAEKIVAVALETGVNPAQVIAYERENENRAAVIAALEALSVPAPDDEELIAA